jgi:hypothetical protein
MWFKSLTFIGERKDRRSLILFADLRSIVPCLGSIRDERAGSASIAFRGFAPSREPVTLREEAIISHQKTWP